MLDRLQRLAKDVNRDVHKMHAFVRFREIDDSIRELYKWYEARKDQIDPRPRYAATPNAPARWPHGPRVSDQRRPAPGPASPS